MDMPKVLREVRLIVK